MILGNYTETWEQSGQVISTEDLIRDGWRMEGDREVYVMQDNDGHREEMAMVPYAPSKRLEEASSREHTSAPNPSSHHGSGNNTADQSVPKPPLLLNEDPQRRRTDSDIDPPERGTRLKDPKDNPTPPRPQADRGTVTAEDQKLEGLETVLIFRMILYAMLLETAVDTSDILAMEERDRYVYVL